MPTTMEGLTQLGSDLRDAIASVLGLRGEMQVLKDSTTTNATTIIQNFQNRAPSVGVFVDENNGVDDLTPGRGTTDTKPFKTIDFALENTDKSVVRVFYLFSDVVMRQWHAVSAPINFTGFLKAPSGSFGWQYTIVQRKLSFLSEATNSPRSDIGRILPFLDSGFAGVSFTAIDIVIPTAAPGINYNNLISMQGNCGLINVTITAETAGTTARLFAQNGQRSTIAFNNVTLGANAPGKVFQGVPAGTDPNALFSYETNLKSA